MEDFARSRRRLCPSCTDPLVPTIRVPEAPDYWVRYADDDWKYEIDPPRLHEMAMALAYRCTRCVKTFRRVVPLVPLAGASGS
jgi:hypothetical protein